VADQAGRCALGVDGEHLPHLGDGGDLLPERPGHDELLLVAGATNTPATFGDRGQRTTLGTTSSTYTGLGNTDRLSDGTITFNNGALGLAQRTSGSTVQNITRTPRGQAVGLRTSAKSYYVHDHLGSVVGNFSSTGTYNGGYSYSPYGEARYTSTNSTVAANPLRYVGQHHDGNNVYKLGARYYDASLGRFSQPDPSGQEGHPYAYAGGNPIVYADPSGLASLSTIVTVAEALLMGKDIYQVLSAQNARDGVQALFSLVCGVVAGAIAGPTVVGAIVSMVGCAALGQLADDAMAERAA
jgi:RHS repeat-associated protein